MKIVYEPRASTILYNLLVSRPDKRPFLLPANICPIVPITFMKARAPFEFVDISTGTLNMDLGAALIQLKSRKFGGVLYAHTYGEASTPEEFFAGAKSIDESFLLIDDRCLCDPETEPSQVTAAGVVLFSSGYGKVVDLGYGGYGFLNETISYTPKHLKFDKAVYETLEKEYKSVIASQSRYVYRDSDWLQTDANLPPWKEYSRSVADGLERAVEHRKAINAIYAERLPAKIQLSAKYQNWRFNILVSQPKRVIVAIFKAGLFASSHYASLGGIFSDEHDCAQAENLAGKVINLFNDYHYSTEMAGKTCDLILKNL